MAGKKRVRDVPLFVWVRPDELEAIRGRMEEAGIRNMSAYIRKMALNGYILHVDLSPVQELVSLQRRCANNLNQVATHANSYGVYQEEIKSLQQDYAQLWGPLSDLLQKLSEVVRLWQQGAAPRRSLSLSLLVSVARSCGNLKTDLICINLLFEFFNLFYSFSIIHKQKS